MRPDQSRWAACMRTYWRHCSWPACRLCPGAGLAGGVHGSKPPHAPLRRVGEQPGRHVHRRVGRGDPPLQWLGLVGHGQHDGPRPARHSGARPRTTSTPSARAERSCATTGRPGQRWPARPRRTFMASGAVQPATFGRSGPPARSFTATASHGRTRTRALPTASRPSGAAVPATSTPWMTTPESCTTTGHRGPSSSGPWPRPCGASGARLPTISTRSATPGRQTPE